MLYYRLLLWSQTCGTSCLPMDLRRNPVFNRWFLASPLLLNPSKTEAVASGPRQRQQINWRRGVDVAGVVFEFTDAVQLLAMTLDCGTLSFDRRVVDVARNCNFPIRARRHIRPLPTCDAAKLFAASIISSRLDYCNSLFYRMTEQNFDRVLPVQNSLARDVPQAPWKSTLQKLEYPGTGCRFSSVRRTDWPYSSTRLDCEVLCLVFLIS